MTYTSATRSPVGSATHRVGQAWTHSSLAVRSIAVAGATVAMASATSNRVPIAAGLGATLLVAAALVDVHERRLPNRTIALALLVFLSIGTIEGVVASPASFVAITIGAAVFAIPILMLHVAAPGSMGLGDVKFSAALGMMLGAVDWRLALWALAIGAGVSAVGALATKQASVAFGPGLVAASIAMLAIVADAHAFQVAGS